MKKTLVFLLAVVLILQTFAGLAVAQTDSENEITVSPVEKAYVRDGNEWKDMNWLEIIEKRGLNKNNDEPLILKTAETGYNRYIYFTFDISAFNKIPFKNVFFKPNFNKVGEGEPVLYDIFKVDPRWKTDSITWSTQPERMEKIASGCVAGAIAPVDLTDAVDAALSAGETKISFVLVAHPQATTRENRIDYRGTALIATVFNNTTSYTKQLVSDPAETRQFGLGLSRFTTSGT